MTHLNLKYFLKVFSGLADTLKFKAIMSAAVVFINWIFDNDFSAIGVIYTLMVIDCILGVSKVVKSGEIPSSRGFYQTCVKFTAYTLMIMTGKLIDKNIGFTFAAKIIEVFLSCTEGISILENIEALGYPVPSKLVKKIKSIRNKNGK